MFIIGDEPNQYDGSRLFTWLADYFGLSVDLINFLLSQVLALFLASLFRSVFHPSKVSSGVRHAFGLIIGLFFGYFCFGQQAIHIAGLPALCYIVIRTQNPEIVQRIVMVVALTYLSCVHLHRLYYDYGSYSVDVTGPLMIITQKVTTLAFSIHDGLSKDEKQLTKSQQYHAIRTVPSPLEFFSYVFHFQGILAGPMVFYKDYIEFIEGTQILRHVPNRNIKENDKQIVFEPSPTKAIVKKVLGSLICAYIFMKFVTIYPIKTLKDDDFINNTSLFYKFWFIMMSTTIVRFKYYHAWLLADAICNNSGLGFNGYDKDDVPKWDLISNINVISFELGTNMRDAINNWNMGTNRWLRTVVYERVPKKYGTVLTFGLSALWHGFYPGYYVTFASGALIVMAGRMSRKLIRHRFQHTLFMRIFYDILTVLTTRVYMGYATFPFVLYEFQPSLRLYLKLYLCLHLVAFITIFILPKYFRGEPQKRQQQQQQSCINENSNGIDQTTMSFISSSKLPLNSTNIVQLSPKIERFNNNNSNKLTINNEIASSLKKCDNNNDFNNVKIKQFMSNNLDDSSNNVPATNNNLKNGVTINGNHEDVTLNLQNINDNNENLSYLIREKIDLETKHFEDFIDKTVTGIVEFKDDLMRRNYDQNNVLIAGYDGLNGDNTISNGITGGNIIVSNNTTISEGLRKRNPDKIESVDAFIKAEMDALNAAVQQSNVLPAVLSNGHAK